MKKVLIIEDDLIVSKIYRNKFTAEGFSVEVANDGEAGMELVKSFAPDAVLLDIMLPKVSGLEVMKQVRSLPAFEKIPIIVFSSTYVSGHSPEDWQSAATKYLSKTECTPRQVLDAVRTSLDMAPLGTPPDRPAGTSATADEEFQAALCHDFVATLPATLTALRSALQAMVRAGDAETRLQQLHEMYRRVRALTGNAAIVGLVYVAQMAEAFEALLKELVEKPEQLNPSTTRTVASAVDFLGFLFEHGVNPRRQEIPSARILVVDDEVISRRALTYALEKANLKSMSCEDPAAAVTLLEQGPFDLVFLDVDMPGMNGFELCTKLRTLPQHKKTPVVFVTGLSDFDSRASSTMSGGNDFIGKPFMFIELAVKALIHVLRGKLTRPADEVQNAF